MDGYPSAYPIEDDPTATTNSVNKLRFNGSSTEDLRELVIVYIRLDEQERALVGYTHYYNYASIPINN